MKLDMIGASGGSSAPRWTNLVAWIDAGDLSGESCASSTICRGTQDGNGRCGAVRVGTIDSGTDGNRTGCRDLPPAVGRFDVDDSKLQSNVSNSILSTHNCRNVDSSGFMQNVLEPHETWPSLSSVT